MFSLLVGALPGGSLDPAGDSAIFQSPKTFGIYSTSGRNTLFLTFYWNRKNVVIFPLLEPKQHCAREAEGGPIGGPTKIQKIEYVRVQIETITLIWQLFLREIAAAYMYVLVSTFLKQFSPRSEGAPAPRIKRMSAIRAGSILMLQDMESGSGPVACRSGEPCAS